MQVQSYGGKHSNSSSEYEDNNVLLRKRTRMFVSSREDKSMFRPFDVRFSTEHHHRIVVNTENKHESFADNGVIQKPNAVEYSVAELDECDDGKKIDTSVFFGAYGHLRKKLDYTYHSYYRKERQWLHDSIIEDFLEHQEEQQILVDGNDGASNFVDNDLNASAESETERTIRLDNSGMIPLWLIFSVGLQGAGKHYTINKLVQNGQLRLVPFVSIAPDDIRHYLPEYSAYHETYSEKVVDELTRKECGYIAETIVLATLEAGRNAILHCQMRDSQWYKQYVQDFLRQQYPTLKVALFHIIADKQILEERESRMKEDTNETSLQSDLGETEDVVSKKNLRVRQVSFASDSYDAYIDEASECIPKSVSVVKSVVDFFCVIHNKSHGDPLIVSMSTSSSSLKADSSDSIDWSTFTKTFDPMPSGSSHPSRAMKYDTSKTYQDAFCRRRHCRFKCFSPLRSTEDYHRSDDTKYYGQFAHLREKLDYSYHANYTRERQYFQDAIIREFLNAAVIKDKYGEVCTTPTEPWIVFTAGAMGAGKSYTMNKLVNEGRFPLLAFVQVDPDAIRRHLPEFPLYVKENPEFVGELTGKEAGLIAEILTLAGLQGGKNVLVDGSLRHAEWYEEYFATLRKQFCNLKISIIHVTAPHEAVFERAEQRARQTGRRVPREVLIEALEQVPKSVKRLAPLVDYHVELRNDPNSADIELVTEGETWLSFERHWIQTCAWVPRNKKKILEKSKILETKLAKFVAR